MAWFWPFDQTCACCGWYFLQATLGALVEWWYLRPMMYLVELMWGQPLPLYSPSCPTPYPSNPNTCFFLVFGDWEASFSVFKAYILCSCICHNPQNVLWTHSIIKNYWVHIYVMYSDKILQAFSLSALNNPTSQHYYPCVSYNETETKEMK